MNIIDTLAEYKGKIEALAGKAAQAETALADLETLKTDKDAMAEVLVAKESELNEQTEKANLLAAEVETLKAEIAKREEDKKASDEKALEIVAALGLKEIPVITVTESTKPTAEQIREKYLAISDPVEKGKFFNEHRNVILNGMDD